MCTDLVFNFFLKSLPLSLELSLLPPTFPALPSPPWFHPPTTSRNSHRSLIPAHPGPGPGPAGESVSDSPPGHVFSSAPSVKGVYTLSERGVVGCGVVHHLYQWRGVEGLSGVLNVG
eukprot:762181-Hanusia_phi.AAC.7